MNSLIGSIILWMIGLFIMYLVIYAAVKEGINKSLVGQLIQKKYGLKEDKNAFPDKDLDDD